MDKKIDIEQLYFDFPTGSTHNTGPVKVNPISPADRELIECVISAACQYFDANRQQLIGEYRMANARHLCYYIIATSTIGIYDYHIGSFFNKGRTAVQYGIGLISSHKNIYRQTLGNLNGIIEIANNLEKKFKWHIPLMTTTH